ncbi:macro domain-containing protein [Oscillibacter sp.]|jgi:O-acetyl-ADP-ribose deacetylase (regulator of RNase III)/transcriptional regulator with XRE-family HTH domain|uniref:macro domain-containing protein n=1 Tax=Oscillibacter sp. TaxID=1945593 RepID=UPI00289F71D6|nr:macro domain-containing protein [Oscillibacter sp.]
MPFTIVRQDITKMTVDAIVNAANTDLAMGGGVCGAIFKAAGAQELQAACNQVAPIKTGEAAIIPSFALPCKYVIHAVGPVYRHWNAQQSEALLRSAYTESLRLASKNHIQSIAFPLISSGIFGYPKDEALKVASSAITDYLQSSDMDVFLAVFDKTAFAVSEKLLGEIESYIDEHYVEEHRIHRRDLLDVEREALSDDAIINYNAPMPSMAAPAAAGTGIDELVGNLDEPFGKTLLRLIDTKGKTDVEVYKRANIDRKLFSKIRTGKGYMPGKRTILALAIALELTLDETDDLLECAGFALSHSQKFDVIVEYFIVSGRFDIFEINEVLFKYDQPLLGG